MSYDPSHRMPPRQERWPSATPAEGLPPYRDADAYRGGEQSAHRYEAGAYPATRSRAGYQYAGGGPDDRGYSSPVATDTFPPAGTGYGYQAGGYQADRYPGSGRAGGGHGYAADAFDGTVNGYRGDGYGHTAAIDGYASAADGYPGPADGYPGPADGYPGPADGYAGAGNGYVGTLDGYPAATNGLDYATDGFDRAADGYGRATDGFDRAADRYGRAEDGYGLSEDGYRQAPGGYDHAEDGYRQGDDGYGDDPDSYEWDPNGYRITADGFAARPNDLGPGSYTEYSEHSSGDPRLVAPDAGVHPDTWQAEQDGRRQARQRGMLVGAVTEVLGMAVAIGVSTLAAGLLKAQTSPAAAMGSVFIDRTPAALRNALAHHFGPHGRTVLLLGMYAAIAFAALVIGVLARRAAALGVAGIAAFTLAAAFVAVTRPAGHVGDVTPAVVGGIAGVAALLWLVRAAAAPEWITPPRPTRGGTRRRTR